MAGHVNLGLYVLAFIFFCLAVPVPGSTAMQTKLNLVAVGLALTTLAAIIGMPG